jgi:hypothetical protein
MTHLLPSKSSTLKQKRLIKKYRDRSLRLLEKINPSEKRGVYHQSEPALRAFFMRTIYLLCFYSYANEYSFMLYQLRTGLCPLASAYN